MNASTGGFQMSERPFLRYDPAVAESVVIPPGVTVDNSMQPKDINLDAKVTVDGKSYTVKELVAARAERDTLRTQNEELGKLKEDVRLMYQPDIAPESGRAALVRSLTATGWKKEDAEKEAAETFGAAPGTPAAPAALAVPQPTMTDKVAREFVDIHMENVCKSATNTGDLKMIVDGITKRDGEAAGKSVADGLQAQVQQELMTLMQRKRELEGTFKVRWMDQLSAEAAKIVAGKARLLTGDPKNLGKAPNLGGDDPLTSYLEKPPVAAPSYQPNKMSGGSLDRQMEDFIADGFVRNMAKNAAGSGV